MSKYDHNHPMWDARPLTADDEILIDAYKRVGVELNLLPYTHWMETLADYANTTPRAAWIRLRRLYQQGRLPHVRQRVAECHRCGRDMGTVSGGMGNMTHDGKIWCGCAASKEAA